LVAAAVLLLVVACAAAPLAPAARDSFGTLTMDDGVPITDELMLPEGPPPVGGWPAVLLPRRQIDQSLGQVFYEPRLRGAALRHPRSRGLGRRRRLRWLARRRRFPRRSRLACGPPRHL